MLTNFQSHLHSNTLLRQITLVLLAVGVGAAGGLAIVAGNPVVPFVALVALLPLPWLITRPMADVLLVMGTLTLLPFAASPVRLALFTPTLLEVALLLLYVAWLLRALLNTGEGLARTPLDPWLLLFMGCTGFAFVLGLGRDSSTDVVHNYFKLVLSVGLFFGIANVLRTPEQVATALCALISLGAVAATLGVVLWRLPDALAESLLGRLRVVGYPTARIVRYVEDNPALGERAVGTQVDPNSFAGVLVIVAAFTGVALLARRPLLPRWLLALMLLADLGAIVLTQSRSALLGIVAAGVVIATLRYRHLWAWGLAGVAAVAVLGAGSGYLARLAAGVRFEDQASLMRLAEYRNALDIIGQYPAFGVGFGSAGELNLTTGVSSVYLTVAERTGLLGLGFFLLTMALFFAHVLPAIRASKRDAPPPGSAGESEKAWSALDTALLGGGAALAGALLVGLVDHYYFNIEFPHTVALFWLAASLALVGRRLLFDKEA